MPSSGRHRLVRPTRCDPVGRSEIVQLGPRPLSPGGDLDGLERVAHVTEDLEDAGHGRAHLATGEVELPGGEPRDTPAWQTQEPASLHPLMERLTSDTEELSCFGPLSEAHSRGRVTRL